MSPSLPSLSIIVPNYNHAQYIGHALQGILGQSRPPDELIVIDDASSDNSIAVIEEIVARDPRIRLVRNERNLGVIATVNKGLHLAKSDYVCFSAADDVLYVEFAERSMDLLASYPSAGLCSTTTNIIDEAGIEIGQIPPVPVSLAPSFFTPSEALRTMQGRGVWFMGNTCIFRRDAFQRIGGFDPDMRSYCDGFAAMVLAGTHGACYIPEPLAAWRRVTTSYSAAHSNQVEAALEMLSRATHLMRTKYRDIFPLDFVEWWEEEQLCAAALAAFRRRDQDAANAVRALFPSDTTVDRLSRGAMRAVSASQTASLAFLLLVRKPKVMGTLLERRTHRQLASLRGAVSAVKSV